MLIKYVLVNVDKMSKKDPTKKCLKNNSDRYKPKY